MLIQCIALYMVQFMIIDANTSGQSRRDQMTIGPNQGVPRTRVRSAELVSPQSQERRRIRYCYTDPLPHENRRHQAVLNPTERNLFHPMQPGVRSRIMNPRWSDMNVRAPMTRREIEDMFRKAYPNNQKFDYIGDISYIAEKCLDHCLVNRLWNDLLYDRINNPTSNENPTLNAESIVQSMKEDLFDKYPENSTLNRSEIESRPSLPNNEFSRNIHRFIGWCFQIALKDQSLAILAIVLYIMFITAKDLWYSFRITQLEARVAGQVDAGHYQMDYNLQNQIKDLHHKRYLLSVLYEVVLTVPMEARKFAKEHNRSLMSQGKTRRRDVLTDESKRLLA